MSNGNTLRITGHELLTQPVEQRLVWEVCREMAQEGRASSPRNPYVVVYGMQDGDTHYRLRFVAWQTKTGRSIGIERFEGKR